MTPALAQGGASPLDAPQEADDIQAKGDPGNEGEQGGKAANDAQPIIKPLVCGDYPTNKSAKNCSGYGDKPYDCLEQLAQWFQVVIGFVGLWLIYWAGGWAKSAYRVAFLSFKFAKRDSAGQAGVLRKQLRAYVMVSATTEGATTMKGKGREWTVTFKNYGQTPCQSVSASINTMVLKPDEPIPTDLGEGEIKPQLPLGSGNEFSLKAKATIPDNHAVSATYRFLVYGVIKFKDVFDDEHTERYRLECSKNWNLRAC